MNTNKTIDPWIERDLTADFKRKRLQPAFEVDDDVNRLAAVIACGRTPVITGPSGIGKTAIVHELIRRSQADANISRLYKRRVIQVSLERRRLALKINERIGPTFDTFVEALKQAWHPPVVFIRDLDFAYDYDLESALTVLAACPKVTVICEGSVEGVAEILEDTESLQRQFVTVEVEEPDYHRTKRILCAWTGHQQANENRTFADNAAHESIALTHRFLGRDRMPRKAIDLLENTAANVPKKVTIESSHVIDRFCATHRTPRVLVDPRIPLDLDALRQEYKREIVGQPEAIDAIVEMIGVIKAGLSDLRRPMGVFLLVGGSGVGKTHLAHLVAKHLFASPDRLVRINMADLGGGGDADRLFGCGTAPEWSARRGMLTMRILGHPFGVVLLDEFEKANAAVHDRFLQLIDEGAFINGDGEFVPCRSLIFIATSNAGALGNATPFGFKTSDAFGSAAKSALERSFRFELLNRFDRIIQFKSLDRSANREIVRSEVKKLGQRFGLIQRKLVLHTDDAVIDWIVEKSFDPEQGARAVRRAVERWLTTELARVMVQEFPPEASRISLTLRDDKPVAVVLPIGDEGTTLKQTPATLPMRQGTHTNHRVAAGFALSRPIVEKS
jgi:ATP-dependent Clp protease ATP-binding subunit ClpA